MKWGQQQGGVAGYTHSGNGLEPVEMTSELPNYILPRMDGIGANEYIMTVAHDAVDIFSLGNTPSVWELNMWYHTLNAGFKTRISGETDFPCVTDERVGQSRVYAKMDDGLQFHDFITSLKAGKSYVSDGFSHLIDFSINGVALGDGDSELNISSEQELSVSVRVAARLDDEQSEIGKIIQERKYYEGPFWHVEKARVGKTRNVPVELIVNGEAVDRKEIVADGNWSDLEFDYKLAESAWIAVRILPSAHTNPIFVYVDNQAIAQKKSINWCIDALDKCWEAKNNAIRASEKAAAKQVYDEARNVYKKS